jgi:hypothetical protein
MHECVPLPQNEMSLPFSWLLSALTLFLKLLQLFIYLFCGGEKNYFTIRVIKECETPPKLPKKTTLHGSRKKEKKTKQAIRTLRDFKR